MPDALVVPLILLGSIFAVAGLAVLVFAVVDAIKARKAKREAAANFDAFGFDVLGDALRRRTK